MRAGEEGPGGGTPRHAAGGHRIRVWIPWYMVLPLPGLSDGMTTTAGQRRGLAGRYKEGPMGAPWLRHCQGLAGGRGPGKGGTVSRFHDVVGWFRAVEMVATPSTSAEVTVRLSDRRQRAGREGGGTPRGAGGGSEGQ